MQTKAPTNKHHGLGTPYILYYGRMIKKLGVLIKGEISAAKRASKARKSMKVMELLKRKSTAQFAN